MIKYEIINAEWRIDHETYSSGKSSFYKYRGATMFGKIYTYPTYYYPMGRWFYFETDEQGFRHEITKDKLNDLISLFKIK